MIFVATEDGRLDGALLPVGWYEEATIEEHYEERPEKDLDQSYEYILTTGTERAYFIPEEKRSSFPAIPSDTHAAFQAVLRLRSFAVPWRALAESLCGSCGENSRPQTPR